MSSRAKHNADCLKALGKEYDEVNKWLDTLASITWPSMSHRRWRHHKQGIEEVRRKFGDEAAKAAEIHIQADFGFIPKDEAQVVLWLKSHGWRPGEEEEIQARIARLRIDKERGLEE